MPYPTGPEKYLREYWGEAADPIDLDGNTLYWLVIQSTDRFEWGNTLFGGLEGDAVFLDTRFTERSWHRVFSGFPETGPPEGIEMVFSLTGYQIPAPGAAVLALLGFPAIGWAKRRFSIAK